MENIIITFNDRTKKAYPKGIKYVEILEDLKKDIKYDIICGKYENQLLDYEDKIMQSGNLTLYDINTIQGNKIYERGLIVLFMSCFKKLFGTKVEIKIRQPINKGIFFQVGKEKKITKDDISGIKKCMWDIVKKKLEFQKIETSKEEAINYFRRINRLDKVKILSYSTSSFVKLYKFNDMYHYIVGNLPHDSSVLKFFDLNLLDNNSIILRFPFSFDNAKIANYIYHEKFVNSLEEYYDWSNLLNISNVGDLNEQIIKNGSGEIINLSETIQDYKLLSIAEDISLNKDKIRLVLISGPSSSGKTTTAKKLALYLKALGVNPYHLSLDDYFLERDNTPIDDSGKPDFESLKAIDVKLFNNQMDKLLKGSSVITPTYDFIQGKKIFNRTIQLRANDILIVEGLHALNPNISKSVSHKNKYKIYISPLGFLNIDDDNRISLTDIRLLRRIVRDYRTRGYTPSKTIEAWLSVRRGEDKYVFPYLDDADVIFNSFLAYELCVLKTYVEPLLYSVPLDHPYYHTALRLLKTLDLVIPIPSTDVPKVSILREFIGESYFE